MIVITGGHGLVGSAIKTVVRDNPDYMFLDRRFVDLRDRNRVSEVLGKLNPDVVVHLAAKVGGLYSNSDYKLHYYVDNVHINTNVLEVCKNMGVPRVLSCLSTCIFPDRHQECLTESVLHDGPPHPSNEGYAYAKRMLDVHSRLAGYNTFCPTNVFGPNDNFDLQSAHVIPALIHKCFLAKQSGKPFVVKGSGNARRQFLYSLDLARFILWAIQHHHDPETIIVSPAEEYTIREVVDIIVKEMGFKGDVVYDTSYPDGQIRKTCDTTKFRTALPDFQFTSFENALRYTVMWFLENYHKVRGSLMV